jgi:murein DD-endopeptidase MepM/ murein hydrolase activator NlpD
MSPQEQHQADQDAAGYSDPNDRNQAKREYYENQQAQSMDQAGNMDAQYGDLALQAGGGRGEWVAPEAGKHLNISQRFGCVAWTAEPFNPNCTTKHWHTGDDIAGPGGTPIFAADTGYIRTFSGTRGYGNYAIVEHGNHLSTLYGHMKAFAVLNGTLVHKGDVIGYEGSTGLSTGPHLHFEVRYMDHYMDPCQVVLKC